MNNLSSYCGLTGARMRASEKDLPVHNLNKMNTDVLLSMKQIQVLNKCQGQM